MPRDGRDTKSAIMDAAESLILEQGFASASIDRIIARAGITKGTFFYHFDSKSDLAYALVKRHAVLDRENLDSQMARAEGLSRDPLQQFLIFIGLMREMMEGLTEPYPGCLYAAYVYEAELFDDRTMKIVRDALQHWRDVMAPKIRQIMELYPPRRPVKPEALADMLTVVFEGAFIVSKTMNEPDLVAEQIDHYRNYVELLFAPPGRGPAP